MDLDLFVELRNYGLVTWTEYKTMDRNLALAMLEKQNALIAEVRKKQAEEEAKARVQAEIAAEQKRRLNDLEDYASQFQRR